MGFFNGGCDERKADGSDAFVSCESGNSELMPISLETQIKGQKYLKSFYFSFAFCLLTFAFFHLPC